VPAQRGGADRAKIGAMSDARPGSTIFVLFGATGDLAHRMVLPAFATLAAQGLLPEEWRLVGCGRGNSSDDDFRELVKGALHDGLPDLDDKVRDDVLDRFRFAGGGFTEDDPGRLLDVLGEARSDLQGDDPQLVFYLAVPPSSFATITEAIGEHGLADGSRVVYEKPFGTSPDGFRELEAVVNRVFDESQVYRIDHFLGKEAVQDLHVLRFANGLLGAGWGGERVRAVQIDVPETLDVADRAEFYDGTGAVLDMLVTHLFQVAAEVAMEPPASLHPDDLQTARSEVIGKFRPLDPKEVVLGQFDGYRDLDGVADDSHTDTFVAARLWVDSDRWRGVPFLMRTGKRLARSEQRVSLLFRRPTDGPLADELPAGGDVLTVSMAGDGRIDLTTVVKRPGTELDLVPATVSLPLDKIRDADSLPPYARLLHDVLMGNRSLFTRPDGLEHVWTVAAPLLNGRPEPVPYAPGSTGPEAAEELAAPDGWLLDKES
jgi:glucose-6-phosphate 1-dehydrogenase